jgi:hypothetical protein
MDEQRALNIVTALANGVNPQTGEIFPGDSPYQSAEIVRALFAAVRAMKEQKTQRRRPEPPANAGKPWTEAEDMELLAAFDRGEELATIAAAHARTLMGIQARLERHGKVPPEQGQRSPRVPRGGHHGGRHGSGGVADRAANGRYQTATTRGSTG